MLSSQTGLKRVTSISLQEVVKLPLEFVRQLSIKVQHQRPGKADVIINHLSGNHVSLKSVKGIDSLIDIHSYSTQHRTSSE